MCNVRIANEGEWEKHVVECGRNRRQKKFECADCDYATNKKSDMERHRRTRHNETVPVTADSGTDDWEQLDPGNMSDVVGSTPQQPLVDEVVQRKPTRPTPVCAPTTKSKVSQDLLTPRAPSSFRHPMATPRKRLSIETDLSPTRDANTQTHRQLVNASTQTNGQFEDVGTQTEGYKRRRLDRVQETYQRDGKTVVEIHEEENWF